MVDAAAERPAVVEPPSAAPITLTQEVANAWRRRVGAPEEPAPADRVQSLFNDIELYPTKTQVFEMLVCARQCARRKSLTLTFGEFCVFAVELRRCSRQARLATNKGDSSPLNTEKETIGKLTSGSEASPPPCEVFLGGSCNPTTWRSEIAIPMLKKMGITYFNPQVEDWSKELIEVEYRAKAAARALLFVLDSETRAVAASVEAADLAAKPRDLLLVLRPYTRHQKIAGETISDQEYVELTRARATLQEAVERRGLPAFTDIPAALRCARAVLRGARTLPRQPLGHTILRLKRAFDAVGGRATCLPRPVALEALRNVTQAPNDHIERSLPSTLDNIDFETFCAAVAEIAADGESENRVTERRADAGAGMGAGAVEGGANGLHSYNARLRAYGRKLRLDIPKSNGSRSAETPGDSSNGSAEVSSGGSTTGSGSVLTPRTERRLDSLPAMLAAPAPAHDVYLGGAFPAKGPRPEEILRREGLTYVVPRANDYTRMFSAPARRSASAHPESPRTDKKARASLATVTDDDVQLRDRSAAAAAAADRLSASDFYRVTDDVTPQPFKGTYDEDAVVGSRALVFAASAEAPSFATLVLAAHYMALRPRDVVLIVQPLDPAAVSPVYSETAVKDYNRGRHYLTDLARRSGVPVFDNTEAAMACVVQRLANQPGNNTV